MRISRYFIPTIREVPSDAEVASHRLMIRAAMIRKVAAGVYNLLPFGLRAIRKVENIIRQEMNRADAIETLLPSVIPAELWRETGRWDVYGKELLRILDRHQHEYCFGPTHEEVMTDLVRKEVRSYKQLPLTLYQIGTKFRDEIRPRFGVMRAREFIMKDGYSYDRDENGAETSYKKMFAAYERVFKRCGLKFRAVEADTGQIGGSSSHEFMVLANSGESLIVSCPKCGYASNVEKAEIKQKQSGEAGNAEMMPLAEVETPTQKTIEDVSAFLKRKPGEFIKTLVYSIDGSGLLAVLVRGDHEVNEHKLTNLLGVNLLELASPEKVKDATGTGIGFLGPKDLPMKIMADFSIKGMRNAVSGANRDGYHVLNINEGRDFKIDTYGDIRNIAEGDSCPRCDDAALDFTRGIEVGHIFRLGTKYSKALNAKYLDATGKEQVIVMGTYGIGVGRTVAAAIEQSHDENGIIWPYSIAPFQIIILPLNMSKDAVANTAFDLEEMLEKAGYEVLLDDRDERAGFKFNDADLIGIPVQIIVGEKGLKNGEVEIKIRKTGERMSVKIEALREKLKEKTSALLAD